jgi:hypothetical protein
MSQENSTLRLVRIVSFVVLNLLNEDKQTVVLSQDLFHPIRSPLRKHYLATMSSSDPVDAVQKYIETNKDALSQISFGGGKKVIKSEIFVASLS